MKRNEDFRKALGQPDDAFQNTVMDTLNQLNREAMASARPQRRISLRLACTFAALVLLCIGTVLTRYGVSGFLKGQPDSRTDPSVPVETAFVPLAASGAAAVVPGSVLADCELATIKLKEAITDGLGVSLTVEAQPKHEHSLVLDESIDVHMDSPDIIGKTPDYIGQTIMQWAKDHGYQEVLMMHLFTPANETDRTSTSDANIQSLRESFVLQDNGSSLIRLAGGALPDTDTYDLYWQVVPWDMEGQNTYTDIPNGRQISYALLGDKVEDGWTKVTVSPTGETPELMGEYTLIYRMGDNQMDIRRFTSVNFYRTSLSDYCEVRTTFNPLLNLHAVELCRDQEQTSAFGCSDYRIRYHHKEEDGSSVTRLALSIPEKIPDRLWLLMDDPKSPDWETTPPDSYMIINKNEEDQPENSGTAETDLVTLTVKEAVTDGLAVYTTVEVRPKDEHTLVLGYLRPYDDSPYQIGKTPDSDDQTIMQWAKAHGYRNVLYTMSCYPAEKKGQSHDSGFMQLPVFHEDGSVLFRTIYRAATDMETYNESWLIADWDMEQESNDSNHVTFESDRTKEITLQSAISQTPEAPELLASYNLILENGEPAENTLVSLYHTSLSDYCEVRTTDKQMSKLAITELSRKYTSYAGTEMGSYEYHYKEEDGTFVTCISGTLPRNLPDDLQLTMSGPYYLEWNQQTSHTFPLVKAEDTVPGSSQAEVSRPEGQEFIDTELATLTVKEAVTDGMGVYLTMEVQPKHEHSLALTSKIDPHMDSPDVIGETPDYDGQTVMQWAKEHGYREVLYVALYSSLQEPRTKTSDAGITSSDHITLLENGSSLIRLAGGTLPDTEEYGLYWEITPWDMEGKNTYTETETSEIVTLALEYGKGKNGWTKVTVPPAKETPELIGEYTLIYPVDDQNYDLRDTTSVNFYRTSLSDYCEVRTTCQDLLNFRAARLFTDTPIVNEFYPSLSTFIYHHMEKDGSSTSRIALATSEELPDELTLFMDNPDGPDYAGLQSSSFRIVKKSVNHPEFIIKESD